MQSISWGLTDRNICCKIEFAQQSGGSVSKPIHVQITSPSLGTLVWYLPDNVPKGVMTQADAETIGLMLRPHLQWILTVLIAGLHMGNKSREWFAKLRKTEERHNLETLEITLS